MIVVRTAPAGPAARAGIRGVDFPTGALGDVITEVNGKPVRRLSDLTDEIEQIGAGRSVKLTVKRGSHSRNLDVDIVDIGRPS